MTHTICKNCLGIELGSTRIKAVAINENHIPVSSGDYTWVSSYENGVWTYNLDEAWTGLKAALSGVETRESVKAMGISAMMHGYLAFDKDWNLLAPFRTWQNTITGQAAGELTALFGFNIPQRWSIAHLYQAVLNGEEHISQIAHITTLAGYVHYMLTGVNAVGIGEASGMFPIDSEKNWCDETMLAKFKELPAIKNQPWKLTDILPSVLVAGDLVREMNAVTEEEIDALMAEYKSRYEINTPDIEAIRYQAREEIAMKKMLDANGCMAFSNTFQDLYGMEQLPGLASQHLMAQGCGYGGEGDWKVAAMTAIMKAMGEGGNGHPAQGQQQNITVQALQSEWPSLHQGGAASLNALTKIDIEKYGKANYNRTYVLFS